MREDRGHMLLILKMKKETQQILLILKDNTMNKFMPIHLINFIKYINLLKDTISQN